MKRLVLCVLLAATPALAQQPQAPAPQPEPGKERRPLNLRLDNPSRFATTSGDDKGGKELPSLGGDARKIETMPGRETNSPFPKDTAAPAGAR